nr:hypothetical protein [Tanacetum cinerariifolium]
NVKTTQAKEIASLKKKITKLEQRKSLRFLGFDPFRAGSSKRHGLGQRKVSKKERKNLKSQQIFHDIDDVLDEDADTEMIIKDKDEDADTEMIIKDKGNGEKGGSTVETVSIARPDISAARPEDSTAEPKTPPTTTTLFDDEDVTIADTLVKIKNQKAKEKEIAFKDVDDSARPIRSISTLQPLPTVDPKIKVKATERERQKEASKATLAEMYDEVQAQIDADHELAVRLTLEDQEKYTVEERFTHAQLKSMSFKEIQKLYIKEQKWNDWQLRKYHLLDKRLTDLVMMIRVRQTEDCDMLLHTVTTDMKLLVVEIEIDDVTADDVDKVSWSTDVEKSKQVDLKFTHASIELYLHDICNTPTREGRSITNIV